MTARTRRLLAALALAAVTAVAAVACGPASGSPNCPPGQWYVENPGHGWECAPGGGAIFTPPAGSPS